MPATTTNQRVEDLAALVRRMAYALDKPSGNTLLARQALDYLKRNGLQGTTLRSRAHYMVEGERPYRGTPATTLNKGR